MEVDAEKSDSRRPHPRKMTKAGGPRGGSGRHPVNAPASEGCSDVLAGGFYDRCARRFARAILNRYAGVGGTQPSCLAIPRSSRLAQCSMIRPFSRRNQWDWVIAKVL
jgi:hypothetical protein